MSNFYEVFDKENSYIGCVIGKDKQSAELLAIKKFGNRNFHLNNVNQKESILYKQLEKERIKLETFYLIWLILMCLVIFGICLIQS